MKITYAINQNDGLVFSRIDDEIAYPVLQYEKIGQGGNFNQPFEYKLEKSKIFSLADYWPNLKWTKKIPVDIKNHHREFWGMKRVAERSE